jgi:hypothetical protein
VFYIAPFLWSLPFLFALTGDPFTVTKKLCWFLESHYKKISEMLWIRVTGLETLSLIDLFLQNSVQNFPVIDRFFTELGSKLTSH